MPGGEFGTDIATLPNGNVASASYPNSFTSTDWLYVTMEWNASSPLGSELWVGTQASGTADNYYASSSAFTAQTASAAALNIGSWPLAGSGVNAPGTFDDLYISDQLLYPMVNASDITVPTGPLFSVSETPEPTSMALIGLGALALLVSRRRTA